MKQTLKSPKPLTKSTYWMLGYAVLMICLWILPPLMQAPWIEFLQLPMNRFLAMLTLTAAIWLIYEQLLSRRNSAKPSSKQHPDLISQIRKVIQRLLKTKTEPSALFTKKSSAKIALHKLPWLLTLGTSASGKTELIHKSGLKLILNKKTTEPNPNHYFDCYASREAVFFDVAEKLVGFDDPAQTTTFWQDFLHTVQRSHRPVFNGVVINLSIQQLTSIPANQLNQLLAQHKKLLQHLNQTLQKPIPTFITINHMDSLTGFNAFFANLDGTERNQHWGMAFDQFKFSEINQLCERFDQCYDLLIQQLHSQLISKLHQEPRHGSRCAIEEFPLQMEAIKRPLARIIQYLSENFTDKNAMQLHGVFFTATGKKAENIDRLLPAINKTFALSTDTTQQTEQLSTYFTRGLFANVIFPSIWQQQQQMGWLYHYPNFRNTCSLGITSALVITCTIMWTQQLSTNIQSVDSINQNLNQYLYQIKNPQTSIQQTIRGLDALATAVNLLSQQKTAYLGINLNKRQHLVALASAAYQNAVSAFLYHHISTTLETLTNTPKKNAAAQIYTGLKFYLQLIKHQSVNVYEFENWLADNNSIFEKESNETKALQKHLQKFVAYNAAKIKINLPLIQKSRQQLVDLPRHELALTMIQQELAQSIAQREIPLQQINSMIPILTTKSNIIIPGIYSRESFAETYEHLIPQAAEMALQGNWVTGSLDNDESIDAQTLVQQTADLYFDNYASTWQTILNKLQLAPFSSYQHAIQVMDNFTTQNSPLHELLQIANYHTDVKYNDISTPISIKFQGLHKLFDAYGENSFYAITAKIRKLQEILATIANTPDHSKAAFIIARQRMLSDKEDIFDEVEYQAIALPPPLRQWVLTLNQAAWQLILNDARSYINQAWQNQIVSYYNQHLQPNYPFNNKARKEIKLPEFNQFFAQLGTVDKFYLDYVAAFVDHDGNNLAWKKRNAASLGSNNIFLANLQQLLGIRDAFFTQNPTSASLEFTVQPLALQPIVKTSLFSIDEQQARFSHYAQVPQSFTWPSKQALHMSALSIISVDGRQVKTSETGLWSLFRLLHQGTIEPTQENNNVLVTFDIKGYGVQFELINQANVNPFNPQLFAGGELAEVG